MFQKNIEPSEILKQFINYYHVIEIDSSRDFLPTNRIYSYGCIVLVFHYGKPSLFKTRDGYEEIEPRTVICGQQTSYYDLSLSGKTGMIFVVFKPHGARMFFNMPMNEIADQNVAFEHIIKKEALEIEDKIISAKSVQERVNLIEDFLLKRLTRNSQNHEQIISVFKGIYHSNGQITVKQLAEMSCLGIKQFERKFSEFVGLNPKQYLRIIRFQNSLQLRNSCRFINYTSMAFDCGYYDQSHFIHDFKIITGLSPKKFFDTRFPDGFSG